MPRTKPNLKETWWKAMHLRRHWGFALNTCNILQPPHIECGIRKKPINVQ
jgi:hypothetical protein